VIFVLWANVTLCRDVTSRQTAQAAPKQEIRPEMKLPHIISGCCRSDCEYQKTSEMRLRLSEATIRSVYEQDGHMWQPVFLAQRDHVNLITTGKQVWLLLNRAPCKSSLLSFKFEPNAVHVGFLVDKMPLRKVPSPLVIPHSCQHNSILFNSPPIDDK